MKRTFIIFLAVVFSLILAGQALAGDKIPKKLALRLGELCSGDYLVLGFEEKGKDEELDQTYLEVAGEVIHDYGKARGPIIGAALVKGRGKKLKVSISGSTFDGEVLRHEASNFAVDFSLEGGDQDPIITLETWAYGDGEIETNVFTNTVTIIDTTDIVIDDQFDQ